MNDTTKGRGDSSDLSGISSRRRTLQNQTKGRRDSSAVVGNSSRRRILQNQTTVPLPMDGAIVFVPRPSTVLGLGSLLEGIIKCLTFLFFLYLIFFKRCVGQAD